MDRLTGSPPFFRIIVTPRYILYFEKNPEWKEKRKRKSPKIDKNIRVSKELLKIESELFIIADLGCQQRQWLREEPLETIGSAASTHAPCMRGWPCATPINSAYRSKNIQNFTWFLLFFFKSAFFLLFITRQNYLWLFPATGRYNFRFNIPY